VAGVSARVAHADVGRYRNRQVKRTIKQWCKLHDVDWYGQGTYSKIRYDWKLVFGPGRVAMFSSMVKSKEPETHEINGRKILLFPNVNSPRNNGQISEQNFLDTIKWVGDCLVGKREQ